MLAGWVEGREREQGRFRVAAVDTALVSLATCGLLLHSHAHTLRGTRTHIHGHTYTDTHTKIGG